MTVTSEDEALRIFHQTTNCGRFVGYTEIIQDGHRADQYPACRSGLPTWHRLKTNGSLERCRYSLFGRQQFSPATVSNTALRSAAVAQTVAFFEVLQNGYIASWRLHVSAQRRHNGSNVEIHETEFSTLADICASMNLA